MKKIKQIIELAMTLRDFLKMYLSQVLCEVRKPTMLRRAFPAEKIDMQRP